MSKTVHFVYISFFFAVGIFITVYISIFGYNYYILPLEERFYNPLDSLLKPSGLLGHGFGIIGSLMIIVGVSVYMIRKQFRTFVRIGLLKHWLEFHIFLCSVGPILVLYHTSFKFGGIVSISFWSMVIVVLSGVVGRFIYVQIPRSIHGNELNLDELDKINQDLSNKLQKEYSIDYSLIRRIEDFLDREDYKKLNSNQVLLALIKNHKINKLFLMEIKKSLIDEKLPIEVIKQSIKLIKQKIIITRRTGLLKYMQKLFKYWHIAHLPFAFIMLIIMLIHVAVAYVFGYKWIF
ncbi:MAG: hypothetical protein V1773_16635 [bacterium]